MKVYKNNWWNNIFHKEELAWQANERIRCKKLIKAAERFGKRLSDSESLTELFHLHKEMWREGFRNKNLGPDEYGMFRTKDIETMTPSEVFLGDIYGLWTYSITDWENSKDGLFGPNCYGIEPTMPVIQLLVNQYKKLLLSNLAALCHVAEKNLDILNGKKR